MPSSHDHSRHVASPPRPDVQPRPHIRFDRTAAHAGELLPVYNRGPMVHRCDLSIAVFLLIAVAAYVVAWNWKAVVAWWMS